VAIITNGIFTTDQIINIMENKDYSAEIAFIESVSTEKQDIFTKDKVAEMLYKYDRIEYKFGIGQTVCHASQASEVAESSTYGLWVMSSKPPITKMTIIAIGFMCGTDSNEIIYTVSHFDSDGRVVRAYLIESELAACE